MATVNALFTPEVIVIIHLPMLIINNNYQYYWYQLCINNKQLYCLISMVYGPFISTSSCWLTPHLSHISFENRTTLKTIVLWFKNIFTLNVLIEKCATHWHLSNLMCGFHVQIILCSRNTWHILSSVLSIDYPWMLVISVIRVTAGQQHTPEESAALDPGNHQLSERFDLCLRTTVNSK